MGIQKSGFLRVIEILILLGIFRLFFDDICQFGVMKLRILSLIVILLDFARITTWKIIIIRLIEFSMLVSLIVDGLI